MPRSLIAQLRAAGIEPGDSEELRQQKTLLMFISGIVSVAAGLWLLIYWSMGPHLSASLPLGLQLLVAANLLVYGKFRNFSIFRFVQLSLLLFFPFVAQWTLGDFVSASGLILWGLLAPVAAMLCLGSKDSLPWFVAYLVLTFMTGATDYFLADMPGGVIYQGVPRQISIVFFALNFVTISTVVYFSLRFTLALRERARADLIKAHAALEATHHELAAEQARSEKLLLNVLPASVAHRLKHSDEVIADRFPQATVLFADIVSFTELATNHPPADIFFLLNHIFSHFDLLAESHGLEKIKTIGDAYMVAGGLNEGLSEPCFAVASLAVDMRDWLKNAEHPIVGRDKIQIRIGIATGAVVAGVVGRKKFIYDVWGDVVNLASRITAECTPGEIQCDQAVYDKLKNLFLFQNHTKKLLKGKGTVGVWQLVKHL